MVCYLNESQYLYLFLKRVRLVLFNEKVEIKVSIRMFLKEIQETKRKYRVNCEIQLFLKIINKSKLMIYQKKTIKI
jgi:hypothetical protein